MSGVLDQEVVHGAPPVPSNLLGATVLGGLLGGVGGGVLAVFTFRTMHLETGGMAIGTALERAGAQIRML